MLNGAERRLLPAFFYFVLPPPSPSIFLRLEKKDPAENSIEPCHVFCLTGAELPTQTQLLAFSFSLGTWTKCDKPRDTEAKIL